MDQKLVRFVVKAMLCAITFVLGITPIGIIPIPPANVTIMHIPVIVGTIVFGLPTGLLLGGVFGLTSVIRAFTAPSALVAPLLGSSPLLVILMSVCARLMIPVVTFLVFRRISRKRERLAAGLAAGLGTLTNTVCYLGLMLLFYMLCGIDSKTVLSVIAGVGALNGSLETVAAVIICTPVSLALLRYERRKKPIQVRNDPNP